MQMAGFTPCRRPTANFFAPDAVLPVEYVRHQKISLNQSLLLENPISRYVKKFQVTRDRFLFARVKRNRKTVNLHNKKKEEKSEIKASRGMYSQRNTNGRKLFK